MRHATAIFFASLMLAACSSPEPAADADAPAGDSTEVQQRELVENAIRRAYEAENAEVTEIAMELSPDGSRYIGRAMVRDRGTGAELTVDCRYSTDVTGAPRLNCDRAEESE